MFKRGKVKRLCVLFYHMKTGISFMENLWDVTYKAVYNQTYECYSTVAPFQGSVCLWNT